MLLVRGDVEVWRQLITLFFDCPCIADLWRASGCEAMCATEHGWTMCDLIENWGKLEAKMVMRGAFLAWCIWGERNQMVFQGTWSSHHIILARVSRLVEEQGSYMARIYSNAAARPVASPNKWSSPPPGIIKINADASLEVDGWVGIGVIARNSEGGVLFSA